MRSMSSDKQRQGGSPPTETSKGPASPGHHTKFGGIHHRRDKRYPMRSGRVRPEDVAEAKSHDQRGSDVDDMPGIPKWSEALMLWLSWNSTYEKVTARMCKPGQDAQKLEAMMDEMDQLRRQAIELSEKMLRT